VITYLLQLRPKQIYAIANLVINPIALLLLFSQPEEGVFWLIVGWTIASSLASELARNIVYWLFKKLLDLSINGIAAFGILGFIFVAIFFAAAAVLVLAAVLVILWFHAWYLLRPD
jgi:hypothetical protein